MRNGLAGNAPGVRLARMPYDFTGKVALVTGSSRGIGAGIVRALDGSGARCVVNYFADVEGRNRTEAEAVAASLRNALLVEGDVSDVAQVRTASNSGDVVLALREREYAAIITSPSMPGIESGLLQAW